jgi:hypothetical protein
MAPGREAVDLRVRRRLAQIADRLDELRARRHEMAGHPDVAQPDATRIERAASHARTAREHAAQAATLAMTAYLRSAEVHDRVADLYDQLATRSPRESRYQEGARRHRVLAARDRDRAAPRRVGRREVGNP